jgi:spore photoproduct lyase
MQDFLPQKILVEKGAERHRLAQEVLSRFPQIPAVTIDSLESYKEPLPLNQAKKILALAALRGAPVKPFPKIPHALNLGDYVFNPVSNCHLECTYCILQSYLKNNPVLTLFTNVEDFFSAIRELSAAQAGRILRLGTGELSDSLALDGVTALSRHWIPFFSELPNAYLELKTKTDAVANLLDLDPRGRTVVSWSLAPEAIAAREELKCDSTAERVAAARRVQAAGYPVGLHLDPLIYGEGWREAYRELVATLARELDPRRIAWVSLGSLRFDKELKEIALERFSQTKIFSGDFIAAPDGKRRYFKTIRIEMYRALWRWLEEWSRDFPRYLCMEPPWMWEEVSGAPAPQAAAVETVLVRRLEELRLSS